MDDSIKIEDLLCLTRHGLPDDEELRKAISGRENNKLKGTYVELELREGLLGAGHTLVGTHVKRTDGLSKVDTVWLKKGCNRKEPVFIESKSGDKLATFIKAGGSSIHWDYKLHEFHFMSIYFNSMDDDPIVCIVPWQWLHGLLSNKKAEGLGSAVSYKDVKQWENNWDLYNGELI